MEGVYGYIYIYIIYINKYMYIYIYLYLYIIYILISIYILIYIYIRHQRYRDIPFITGLFHMGAHLRTGIVLETSQKETIYIIHGWCILSHHCRTLFHTSTVDNALSWYAFLFHLKGCCRYHFLYRSTWKEQLCRFSWFANMEFNHL
jgi:hypothetical protein